MPRNSSVRPIKQPDMAEYVQASVDSVPAFDPATGRYATLRYVGIESEQRARELVQGLHRAATRFGYSLHTNAPSAKVSWPANAEDGTWFIEYTCIDKACARAFVLAKYGADRSKWAYSPIKGDKNYG